MIIGDCPYDDCNGTHMVPLAENRQLPCFQKLTCDDCSRAYWLKHSRVDPESFTPEQFDARYGVNEETHQITEHCDKKIEAASLHDESCNDEIEKIAGEIAEYLGVASLTDGQRKDLCNRLRR